MYMCEKVNYSFERIIFFVNGRMATAYLISQYSDKERCSDIFQLLLRIQDQLILGFDHKIVETDPALYIVLEILNRQYLKNILTDQILQYPCKVQAVICF